MLLHLVDGTSEHAGKAYKTVRHEIEAYGHGLSDKPEIVALSKADALDHATLKEQVARLKRASKKTPAVISAASGQGVQEVLQALLNVIDAAKVDEKQAVTQRRMASVTIPDLRQFKRVVLKVGSSLLVDRSAWPAEPCLAGGPGRGYRGSSRTRRRRAGGVVRRHCHGADGAWACTRAR